MDYGKVIKHGQKKKDGVYPHIEPSGGLEVVGLNKAVNKIMKLIEEYKDGE